MSKKLASIVLSHWPFRVQYATTASINQKLWPWSFQSPLGNSKETCYVSLFFLLHLSIQSHSPFKSSSNVTSSTVTSITAHSLPPTPDLVAPSSLCTVEELTSIERWLYVRLCARTSQSLSLWMLKTMWSGCYHSPRFRDEAQRIKWLAQGHIACKWQS